MYLYMLYLLNLTSSTMPWAEPFLTCLHVCPFDNIVFKREHLILGVIKQEHDQGKINICMYLNCMINN